MSLQCLFHLHMAAAGKGVKLIAGVAAGLPGTHRGYIQLAINQSSASVLTLNS
ncbi:hypothetical protein D3C76_441660 [compost metagenome]